MCAPSMREVASSVAFPVMEVVEDEAGVVGPLGLVEVVAGSAPCCAITE